MMNFKPDKRDKILLALLFVDLVFMCAPELFEVKYKDSLFFQSKAIQYVYVGVVVLIGILLVRALLTDHPFLLHPWDEPSEDEDDEDDDEDNSQAV